MTPSLGARHKGAGHTIKKGRAITVDPSKSQQTYKAARPAKPASRFLTVTECDAEPSTSGGASYFQSCDDDGAWAWVDP